MDDLVELVRGAQRGDLEAFGQIVARFQIMAHAIAQAHLCDHHLAQDAAQEAFVEAFLHLARLREPAAFPGWFRQIVSRQAMRLSRDHRPNEVPLEFAVELPATGPDPWERLEQREREEKIREAVRRLPEHERIATGLFYLQGYTYQEVSDLVGAPVTTVKKRLHSARRRLRERMIPMAKEKAGRPPVDDRFARVVQLCSAAAKGELEAVKALLAQTPDLLNQQDGHGDAAVGHAARWGHLGMVRYLLEAGAGVRVQRDGRDAGWSPLFWACGWNAKPVLVALLLRHGAPVNARANHHGASADTVLHTACRFDHPEVVALLIEHGADLNATCGEGDNGYNGYTPLQVSARRGNRAVAAVLLARGATLDLFSAAALGDLKSIEGLLREAPAGIAATDEYGATALHWAIASGQTPAAHLLIDHGADVNHPDSKGRAPLLLAATSADPTVSQFLLENGATVDLFSAAALGEADRLEALLAANPSLSHAKDVGGWTALHWAARTGQSMTGRLLLEHGAPVDARDGFGRTPLWAAAYEGRHLPLVELLLAAGAEAGVKDMFGCGLLAYDVGREIGELLRARGAVE